MMSSLKRSQGTEWVQEVDPPPGKRMTYEARSDSYGSSGQDLWYFGTESHETSFGWQTAISDVVPATNSFPNHHFNPSVEDLWQDQQGLNPNQLLDKDHIFCPGGQEFDLQSSLPAEYSQHAFREVVFANLPVDVSIKSPHERLESASKYIEVCYGTLCDVKVQLDDRLDVECLDRERLNFRDIITETQTFMILQCSFNEKHCLLETKEGRAFGLLNNRVFRSLTGLPCFQDLEYSALVGCHDWKERLFAAGKDSKLSCISLDINVSGPRCELDTAARGLSRAGLFLQPPYQGTTILPYDNPQYLRIPSVIQTKEAPVFSNSQICIVRSSGLSDKEQPLVLTDTFPDFDELLEKLPRHEYLSQVSVDPRIKTSLISHQKEAVDFIVRRETLSSHESRSLWKFETSGKDFQLIPNHSYQHIITGAKSPTPNDFLGGILADDMGLGKSLSMLCAIMGSLDRAIEYAGRWPSLGKDPKTARTTLIIVPSALLLDSWIEEIEKFNCPLNLCLHSVKADISRHVSRGNLMYCKYHGQDRPKTPFNLVQYDVVLTTYGTIVADFNRSRTVLESINWYRLIVDEAHVIRNLSTKQFRAVNKISAHIRWCLTGTPIQNTLADLGALATFLGVPILHEPAIFRKYIDGISHKSRINPQTDFENLRLLLGSICLRRSKAILSLFGLKLEERRVKFSAQERQEYNLLAHKGRIALDLALSGHSSKETHQRIIEALLRLRLYCNNGLPQENDRPSGSSLDSEETMSLLQQSGEVACTYCSCDILSVGVSDTPELVHMTECRRLICGECISQFQKELENVSSNGRQSCPVCTQEHGVGNILQEEMNPHVIGTTLRETYPSKILALLEDIQKNPLHEKSIVFSFWKKSLDLVEGLFNANEVRYCRVDGSLSLGKRKAVLSKFQGESEVGVLIMTLGTGAVGLNNLSIASRIYLLEPQWNPSVESQAIGRIFRLGQERPVTVIRYIMDKSIEENVKNKQLRKLGLASGGFDTTSSAQRLEHLQQLKAMVLHT